MLIRAIEPVHGIPLMQRRRGIVNIHDLCRGPARLCQALHLGREFDGWNLLLGCRLWITSSTDHATAVSIGTSQRIGVTSNGKVSLRFFAEESPFVSDPKRLTTTKRKDENGREEQNNCHP